MRISAYTTQMSSQQVVNTKLEVMWGNRNGVSVLNLVHTVISL
jgi:hypothetical protein